VAPDAAPKKRGKYLVAAFIVGAVALTSVLVAAHSNPSTITGPVNVNKLSHIGPAPALDAKGWINTPPLKASDLENKVVLYDFWTYSCINCQRTFPYVRAWYDRYRADGLVIVGIHSPEFDFEKVHANVQDAVEHYDVTWPVALDDDMTIWNEFKNNYWPADYIADKTGELRYEHFGEGDYDNTENVIRALLQVPDNAPRSPKPTKTETAHANINPETYLDTQHGDISAFSGTHTYGTPGKLEPPQVALGGTWTGNAENVVSGAAGSSIALGVQAQQVNLVMAPQSPANPIDVIVTVDGHPVPIDLRGSDVHVDAKGQTVVTVTHSDMYQVLEAPSVQQHQVVFVASAPGLEAYDFTFG
jgi:thiol-disulfide isomerase/thioredoxin